MSDCGFDPMKVEPIGRPPNGSWTDLILTDAAERRFQGSIW